jgi:molybdopterin molybdotransferase
VDATEHSCGTPTASLLSYEQALESLLGYAPPIEGIEWVDLRAALGRVLAEPVRSRVDLPAWDYSAMDGYAVRSAEVPVAGVTLPVSQRIPAGRVPDPLSPGTAARIFTGAPIPAGADSVLMQEACSSHGDRVTCNATTVAGANVRRRGEDVAAGSLVVEAGVRLQPQHIGMAAAAGVAELPVRRRLRVAVFASGDELVMPGEPLRPGAIYNSNLFTATALLQALGCEVVDCGIVRDTFEATRAALEQAAAAADLVLASGGVSVGEEDHVKPAVEALGELNFWRLAIRPGKPLAFGSIGVTPFLGAPGNPVSLFVTFVLFARPFILTRMGVRDPLALPMRVTAAFDWPRPDPRREFHRARLERDDAGRPVAQVFASRSSGALNSVVWANGLVVIPEGRVLQKGELVDFLPFSELLT